ncbi:heme-degrading monooxygenase HmoA [Scopulibacillus daqui]|uniref:Heme-degrading monooxygenase HmoA n=1 Tax=Scopulibacillus daqui TaxID=1469162 RepID=A0ABS2PWT6_9BACL|nr:antibiotic biosynthesis monooxygenase [Scopulibacillus daqui]MBM7644533.1 heme-degrading monooxygenase HmoA [Scopulibacillus daqui]
MFVSVNTIPVPHQDMVSRMEENFKKSVSDLHKIDGFIRFELWKQEGQVKAVSYWETKEAFDNYINSEDFQKHHHESSGNKNQAQVEYYEAKEF